MSWVSAPDIRDGTVAFRVADFKRQGATFLQNLSDLFLQGASEQEEELEVPDLRVISLDEELRVLEDTRHSGCASDPAAGGAPAGEALAQAAAAEPRVKEGGGGVQEQEQERGQQQQQQQQQQGEQWEQPGSFGPAAVPGLSEARGGQQQQQQPPQREQQQGKQPASAGTAAALGPVSTVGGTAGTAAQGAGEAMQGLAGSAAERQLPASPAAAEPQVQLKPAPSSASVGEAKPAGTAVGGGQQEQQQQQQHQEARQQAGLCQGQQGAAAYGQGLEIEGRQEGGGAPGVEEQRTGEEQRVEAAVLEGGGADPQREPHAQQEGQEEQVGRASRRRRKRPAWADSDASPGQPRETPTSRGPGRAKPHDVWGAWDMRLGASGQQGEAAAQQGPQQAQQAEQGLAGAGAGAVAGAAAPKLVTRGCGVEMKEERLRLLEAYQAAVERVKRQRAEREEQAGQVLHSVRNKAQQAKQHPLSTLAQEESALKATQARLADSLAQRVDAPSDQLVPPGEVLLHVAVHLPRTAAAAGHPPQELLVLGSQPLTALRDAVKCLTDTNVAAVEADANMSRRLAGQPPLQLQKPSAYLYVEGTFYNDMRDPAASDYSQPIRQFNRERSVTAPPHPPPGSTRSDILTSEFSTARMESTAFDQLWLRLGPAAVNLYCHQGGCEHAVVFKDVRLFDPSSDPPLLSQYPFPFMQPPAAYHRLCEVCRSAPAQRVTLDDPETPHTPFFWCEECFRLMHYNEEGVATYTNYRVFPYSYEYKSLLKQQGLGALGVGGVGGAQAAGPGSRSGRGRGGGRGRGRGSRSASSRNSGGQGNVGAEAVLEEAVLEEAGH